eukprot:scaffold3100_cov248-Pinguiococcus_pyrenoidosus.AAC.5
MDRERVPEQRKKSTIVRPAENYAGPSPADRLSTEILPAPDASAANALPAAELSFFENLAKLLEARYPPVEARRIRAQFSALHDVTLDRLNLDDLEVRQALLLDLASLLEAEDASAPKSEAER